MEANKEKFIFINFRDITATTTTRGVQKLNLNPHEPRTVRHTNIAMRTIDAVNAFVFHRNKKCPTFAVDRLSVIVIFVYYTNWPNTRHKIAVHIKCLRRNK